MSWEGLRARPQRSRPPLGPNTHLLWKLAEIGLLVLCLLANPRRERERPHDFSPVFFIHLHFPS
jgi:hypothetical protein